MKVLKNSGLDTKIGYRFEYRLKTETKSKKINTEIEIGKINTDNRNQN